MENYIFVSNVDQGVGERKVAVVQNGKILINGTFTMSFSWRKFVSNLWDTACIPFVVPRRHTNRIYSPLPFGIDTNSAETLLPTLITTTLTNSLLDEKSSFFVSSLILC